MKDGLLPVMGVVGAVAAAYVGAVYLARQRPLGRVLAVLGAGAAGACLGLNAIWLRYDRRGWSASPSGYGAEAASFVAGFIFLVLPLSLLFAGLGTWAGLRLSVDPSSRLPLAVGAAVIAAASIAAAASL